MFQMAGDVVTAVKKNFSNFKDLGISKIQVDIFIVIDKHLEAVVVVLDEVYSLPKKAPLDILKGLSIFPFENFKENFRFRETQESIQHIRKKPWWEYNSGSSQGHPTGRELSLQLNVCFSTIKCDQ